MANRLLEIVHKGGDFIRGGIRIKPLRGKSQETDFDPDDELSSSLAEQNAELLEGINTFRQMSANRNEQYDAFDEMEKDSTIAAALRMYADDATQYNLDGDVIWAESEDTTIAEFANRLIRVLQLNKYAWSHIYNLVKYGDLYLETFYDDEEDLGMVKTPIKHDGTTNVEQHRKGAHIEEYVEMVANPATIFDLRQRGKVAGFIRVADLDKDKTNINNVFSMSLVGTDQSILPSDKFVHIMLSTGSDRHPESFEISFSDGDSSEVKTNTYTVAKGKSILYDVFKSYRELKLMEDSILLNRVTRSSLTRIVQLEVGEMPKNQVREKLRKVKQMFEQKTFMDKNNATFSNMASPGPMDNIVYVPTRNGVGAITSTTLGGDFDPKSLVDLDYYKQKESGGLGIPLSYLQGQSGDGGGLSSGTALTKLDNRYARAIKRIQTAYIEGITQLINIFALRKGLQDYIGEFKIRMLSPSTIEDADRDQQLNDRVRMAGEMVDLIKNDEEFPPEYMNQITRYLMSAFLNKPEIAKMMEDAELAKEEAAEAEEQAAQDTGDSDIDIDIDMDSERPRDFDFGGGPEIEAPQEFNDEDFEAATNDAVDLSDTEPSDDFGDFEEFV